jgi:two-component sensor histidine kinase/PAS domain-containing protein
LGEADSTHNPDNTYQDNTADVIETAPADQLLKLYQDERSLRIAAEQRLEAALQEIESANQSAAIRDYVMASAHCLLWYADILETNDQYLDWQMEFPNIEPARRFLPLEIRPGESLKDAWYLRRHPDDRDECDRVGTAAVRSGQSYQQEFRCYCEDGSIRWLHEDVRVETVIKGSHWRAVGVCTDITGRREIQAKMQAANKRLERSIAETHHRVKNNLQVVAGLVDMQFGESEQTDASLRAGRRMSLHIRALAAMHELLTSEAQAGSDVDSVSVRAVVERLIALALQTVHGRTVTAAVEDIRLPSRQVTGLLVLVNELLINAVQHGEGRISIALQVHNGFAHMEVADEGEGFPPGFDPGTSGGTGLEIVESIGRLDLQGTIAYDTRAEGGGRVSLDFPIEHSRTNRSYNRPPCPLQLVFPLGKHANDDELTV